MANSIEAGKAFVRAYVDLSEIDRGLKQIQAKFENFGSRLGGIGKGISVVGAGLIGIGSAITAPIAAATAMYMDFGSTLKDTSDRTGISAQSLAELGYAAEQSGTDLGTVEKSVSKLQKGIAGAASGNKTLEKSFASIGMSVEQLAKLSPEEQFTTVASAIGNIQNPTLRAAKAIEVFGKSGTQLLPLITSDIQAMRKEAVDLGLSLSDVDASNAEGLGDAFDKVKKTLGGIAIQIGAALAVPLTKIATITANIIGKVSNWVKENRSLVQTVAMIGAGLIAVGSVIFGVGVAVVGVGATIAAIGTVIGSIAAIATTVFGAVASVVGAILTPVGLVVAAVVGLGAYIAYTALSATGSIAKLGDMFGSLGGTAIEAWGGIVAALGSGDFQTAGEIAFTALEVAWLTVTTTMRQVWNNVSDFFVNVWLSVVESIIQVGASIYFGVAKYFDQLSNALVAGFDIAVTYITGAIDRIQTAIAKAIIKAQEFFGLFSKEQSVQIQGILDSDLKRRAGARQNGLDSRSNERGNALDQRDKQRQATAQQFSGIVAEDFQRKRTGVDSSGLTAAQKRLEELKLTLTEKATAAQTNAAKVQEEKLAESQGAGMQFMQDSGSSGSVGTFVSGIAGNISGGGTSPLEDLGKQQLDMLGSIDGRLREGMMGDGE